MKIRILLEHENTCMRRFPCVLGQEMDFTLYDFVVSRCWCSRILKKSRNYSALRSVSLRQLASRRHKTWVDVRFGDWSRRIEMQMLMKEGYIWNMVHKQGVQPTKDGWSTCATIHDSAVSRARLEAPERWNSSASKRARWARRRRDRILGADSFVSSMHSLYRHCRLFFPVVDHRWGPIFAPLLDVSSCCGGRMDRGRQIYTRRLFSRRTRL